MEVYLRKKLTIVFQWKILLQSNFKFLIVGVIKLDSFNFLSKYRHVLRVNNVILECSSTQWNSFTIYCAVVPLSVVILDNRRCIYLLFCINVFPCKTITTVLLTQMYSIQDICIKSKIWKLLSECLYFQLHICAS